MQKKPTALACHLCSCEFGLSSLAVHIPQCEKKWLNSRLVLPTPLQTTRVPTRPSQPIPDKKVKSQIEKYNEEAYEIYRTTSLCKCPGCSRSFNPDALNVHLKSCTTGASMIQNMTTAAARRRSRGKSLSKSLDPQALASALANAGGEDDDKFVGPKHVICYVCGRKFGTASISIHIPQCIEKWLRMQEDSPVPKQLPKPPASALPESDSPNYDELLEKYNEEANQIAQDQGRSQCEVCGRKFAPDRIAKHMEACAKSAANNGKPVTISRPSTASNPMRASTGSFSKPVSLFCYLCGREFGTTSLEIHISQCLKKREASQRDLPQEYRSKPPNPPSFEIPEKGPNFQERIEEFNKEAYRIYEEVSRVQCHNCSRRFNAEALLVHIKGCVPSHPTKSSPSKLPGERPRMLMCCICGREYGSKSLGIHQKNCMIKHGWSEEDLKKAQVVDQPIAIGKMSAQQIEQFNNAAYESYSTNTLVPCENCGRTFLPDRLEVHKRSCKPGKEAKSIRPSSSKSGEPSLLNRRATISNALTTSSDSPKEKSLRRSSLNLSPSNKPLTPSNKSETRSSRVFSIPDEKL